jgi:hypothetical protein
MNKSSIMTIKVRWENTVGTTVIRRTTIMNNSSLTTTTTCIRQTPWKGNHVIRCNAKNVTYNGLSVTTVL